MKQDVTIVHLADRHADLHERQFAEAQRITVTAGSADRTVVEALATVDELPMGRYIITVDEPYE